MHDRLKNNNRYDDIINLPHRVSTKHPQMPIIDRAAQFAPFAALTGYDAAVMESARLTEKRIELDEYQRELLSVQLQHILARLEERPEVFITYFKPDKKKEGGVYLTVAGIIKKINEVECVLHMSDGTQIPIGEIVMVLSSVPGFPDGNTE